MDSWWGRPLRRLVDSLVCAPCVGLSFVNCAKIECILAHSTHLSRIITAAYQGVDLRVTGMINVLIKSCFSLKSLCAFFCFLTISNQGFCVVLHRFSTHARFH